MSKIVLLERVLPKQQAKVLRITLFLANVIFNLAGQVPQEQQARYANGK